MAVDKRRRRAGWWASGKQNPSPVASLSVPAGSRSQVNVAALKMAVHQDRHCCDRSVHDERDMKREPGTAAVLPRIRTSAQDAGAGGEGVAASDPTW